MYREKCKYNGVGVQMVYSMHRYTVAYSKDQNTRQSCESQLNKICTFERSAGKVQLPTVPETLCWVDVTHLTLDNNNFGRASVLKDNMHGYLDDQEVACFIECELPLLSPKHPCIGHIYLVT